jgi:hypothetical protein
LCVCQVAQCSSSETAERVGTGSRVPVERTRQTDDKTISCTLRNRKASVVGQHQKC